jgi:hypothetical protein
MFDSRITSRDGIRAPPSDRRQGDRAIGWLPMGPNGEVALRTIRDETPHRALVVVTAGQRPGLCPINAAFFSEPFGPPVLQIGGEHRAAVEEAARGGAPVRFVANATRRPATASNVVAEVRHAAGLAAGQVMTTRRLARQRIRARRSRLLARDDEGAAARPLRPVRFVASSGHELGHLGLLAYLDANPALARGALAWIHYGANIGAATGDVGMASSTDRLETLALGALSKQGLDGVRHVPAERVGGEAATIAQGGGQFVSFIGQNAWFHNPRDVWPDAVDVPAIARFARATADLALTLALS